LSMAHGSHHFDVFIPFHFPSDNSSVGILKA
jgi:hypothetical protein